MIIACIGNGEAGIAGGGLARRQGKVEPPFPLCCRIKRSIWILSMRIGQYGVPVFKGGVVFYNGGEGIGKPAFYKAFAIIEIAELEFIGHSVWRTYFPY